MSFRPFSARWELESWKFRWICFLKKPSIDEIWDRPFWNYMTKIYPPSSPWTNLPTLGRLFGGTYFTSLSSGCCEVDEGRQQRMGKIRPQRGAFAALPFLFWIDFHRAGRSSQEKENMYWLKWEDPPENSHDNGKIHHEWRCRISYPKWWFFQFVMLVFSVCNMCTARSIIKT